MKKYLFAFLAFSIVSLSVFAKPSAMAQQNTQKSFFDTIATGDLSAISTDIIKKVETFIMGGLNWISEYSQFYMEMLYVIIALSFILFLIRLKRNRGYGSLDNPIHTINSILLVIVSVIEIIYVTSMGERAIWFCKPDEVGWTMTVISFLIFGFIVYNQLQCYLNTLHDLKDNSNADFSWKLGLYSWPAAIIAFYLAAYFFKPGVIIVWSLLIILQLVQIAMAFKDTVSNGGWWSAFLSIIVYLFGAVATIALLVHFFVLLVIVLIGIFVLSIFAGGSTSNSSVKGSTPKKQCPICGSTYGCVCEARRLQNHFNKNQ